MAQRRNSAQDFWKRVHKTDGCWLWMGSGRGEGYGQFSCGNVNWVAHRYAYTVAVGPIPEGMWVLHHCDEPRCVRPDHLWLGTHDDNMADMVAKRRSPRGAQHPMRTHPERVPRGARNGSRTHPERLVRGERVSTSRLNETQVREIRRLGADGVTFAAIGAAFGVSAMTAAQIVKRRTWRHVP